MNRFNDKVVVITGAGSGIGKATALLFASEGARIAASDISLQAADGTAQSIRQKGGQAISVQTDVRDPGQVEDLMRMAGEHYGGLHILFANAGVAGPETPLAENDLQEVRMTIDVNLFGVVVCCRAAIPRIAQSGGGSIIITTSAAGMHGFATMAAYGATKAAVIRLAESLALEYAPQRIRVNAVAPGVVRTPMVMNSSMGEALSLHGYTRLTPLGRLGEPEDIARAVVFLASEEASWITGATLPVDGGLSLRQGEIAYFDLLSSDK